MIRKFSARGSLGLIALGIALQATPAAADVQFSDTGFNDADWQLTVIRGHPATGGLFVQDTSAGSISGSQQTRGGVLGGYRSVTITVNDSVGPVQNFVYGFYRRAGAVYDPSVSGAMGCVSYVEYSRTVSSTEASGCHCQDGALGLVQDGTIFIAAPGFPTPSAPSVWTQKQQVLLNSNDFCAMPDYLGGNCIHPDFSANGSPIQFGFMRGNENSFAGAAGLTTSGGIDNWQVNIVSACTQCSDGIDNDGDGCVDFYPRDLGCSSPTDDSEALAGCAPSGAPALPTWGLIALAATLLATGVYLLRRRA